MSSRVRLGDPQHYRQRFIDGGHDPDGHLRRGVLVAGANAAPAVDLGMAAALVPHQLIDHPGGNAGILQPSGEPVAHVVRGVQVQVRQVLAAAATAAW